jgi:tetratricopeptide (TPR) repeat protein
MGQRHSKGVITLLFAAICMGCQKQEAVTINPTDSVPNSPTLRMPGRASWAQAELDSRAQKTDAERDASYRKFAKELSDSTEFLTLYAIFVSDQLHDIKRAEAIYQQSLSLPTANGFTISNYGNFVQEYYKDKKRAETLYIRALKVSPNDDTSMALYGLFLFENGKPEEGQNYFDRAKRYGFSHNQRILMRVDFCRFSNGRKDEQGTALYTLRTNLINHFRAARWDFSPNIRLALQAKHPESDWLERLAAVCSAKADIATLKPWEAWKEAVRRPIPNQIAPTQSQGLDEEP